MRSSQILIILSTLLLGSACATEAAEAPLEPAESNLTETPPPRGTWLDMVGRVDLARGQWTCMPYEKPLDIRLTGYWPGASDIPGLMEYVPSPYALTLTIEGSRINTDGRVCFTRDRRLFCGRMEGFGHGGRIQLSYPPKFRLELTTVSPGAYTCEVRDEASQPLVTFSAVRTPASTEN